MEISKLSTKNLRYLSNPHYSIYSLFPSYLLSQPWASASPISNSPPYSLISSTGSSLVFSETNPPSHSSRLCQYHHGCTSLSSFSSNTSSSVCSTTYPDSQSSKCFGFSSCNGRYDGYMRPMLNLYLGYMIPMLNLYLFKSYSRGCFRSYSTSSSLFDVSRNKKTGISRSRPKVIKVVPKIIDLIRSNEHDLESKLGSLNVRLSIDSLTVVFRVLNCEKLSALRFFYWIRHWHPELGRNSRLCSLVIDNCAHLNDYDSMQSLLNDFKRNNLCLTKEAFGFLTFLTASKALMMDSTQRVVDVLREVGGSCYSSGILSLIEMFTELGFFDMARFLIKTTVKKVSYYNVLIREMCRKRDFRGARDMLDEMRKGGCDPSVQTYNYIISNLLKNGENAAAIEIFQDMLDKDCPPDALTYEILIYNSCTDGNISTAFKFLDEMVARGLDPRHSTHAAFIKGLFNAQQYEKAYGYVVGSADKCSSNVNYSLLAKLHWKRGNLVIAHNILSEMIKKGLRPDFKTYKMILKCLEESGREELVTDLQEQFLHEFAA